MHNISKRGKSWYVTFKHKGRLYRRSAGRNKRAAEVLLCRLRDDAERGAVGLPRRGRLTLEQFSDDYLAWAKVHKRSWGRDEDSLAHLRAAVGNTRLAELSRARIESYQRARLAAGAAPATVNREVACLRKALSLAVDRGVIDKNPLQGVAMLREAPPRIPFLSSDDEARLLVLMPPWAAVVVRLALATGCRLGELLALRWRHVDIEAGTIAVEDSKPGAPRVVPLSSKTVAVLRRRGHGRKPDEPVLQGFRPGAPSPTVVAQAFKRAARKIGRPELRFHDLRHVAASRFLAAGASLPEVAAITGHKTLIMARRYAHPSWGRLRSFVEAADTGQDRGVNGPARATDGSPNTRAS